MHHLVTCFLAMSAMLLPLSNAYAAQDCSDAFYINETLPNGARWDMCWESRNREGVTFSAVYFTPKNGVRRMVLNYAAVAQIHVPYDDNGTRFHDVSDLGIGGLNMLDLNPDECPGGSLLRLRMLSLRIKMCSVSKLKNAMLLLKVVTILKQVIA